jgi:hypothetical protein
MNCPTGYKTVIAGGGDDRLGLRAQRSYARVLPGFRAFSSSPPNAVPQGFAFQLPGRIAFTQDSVIGPATLSLSATSGGEAWLGFGSFA